MTVVDNKDDLTHNSWLGKQEYPLPDTELFKDYSDMCRLNKIDGLGYAYRIATGSTYKNIYLSSIAMIKFSKEFTILKRKGAILWLTDNNFDLIFMVKYLRDLADYMEFEFLQRPENWDGESNAIILMPLDKLETSHHLFADKLLLSIVFQEAHHYSNYQYIKYSRYRLSFLTKLQHASFIWMEALRQSSYPFIDDFAGLPVKVIHQKHKTPHPYPAKYYNFEQCHPQRFEFKVLGTPRNKLVIEEQPGLKKVADDLVRIKPAKDINELKDLPDEFKLAIQFALQQRSVCLVVESRFDAIAIFENAISGKNKYLQKLQDYLSVISANELNYYPFSHNVIIFNHDAVLDYPGFINIMEHLSLKDIASQMVISKHFEDPQSSHYQMIMAYQQNYRKQPPILSTSSFETHLTSIPNNKNIHMLRYLKKFKELNLFSEFAEDQVIQIKDQRGHLVFHPHLTANDLMGYYAETPLFSPKPIPGQQYYLTAPHNPTNISVAIHQIINLALNQAKIYPDQKFYDICLIDLSEEATLSSLYYDLLQEINKHLKLNIELVLFEKHDYSNMTPEAINQLSHDFLAQNFPAATPEDEHKIRILITSGIDATYFSRAIEQSNSWSPNQIIFENLNEIYNEYDGAMTINFILLMSHAFKNATKFFIGVNDLDFQKICSLIYRKKYILDIVTRCNNTYSNQRQAIYSQHQENFDLDLGFDQVQLDSCKIFARHYRELFLDKVNCDKTNQEIELTPDQVELASLKQEISFNSIPLGIYSFSRSKSIQGLMLRSIDQLPLNDNYLPANGECSYNLCTFNTQICENKYLNNLVSLLLSLIDLKNVLIVSDSKAVQELVPVLQEAGYDLQLSSYRDFKRLRNSYNHLLFIGNSNNEINRGFGLDYLRYGLQLASSHNSTASLIIWGIAEEILNPILKYSALSYLNYSFSSQHEGLAELKNNHISVMTPLIFYSAILKAMPTTEVEQSLQIDIFSDGESSNITKRYFSYFEVALLENMKKVNS